MPVANPNPVWKPRNSQPRNRLTGSPRIAPAATPHIAAITGTDHVSDAVHDCVIFSGSIDPSCSSGVRNRDVRKSSAATPPASGNISQGNGGAADLFLGLSKSAV